MTPSGTMSSYPDVIGPADQTKGSTTLTALADAYRYAVVGSWDDDSEPRNDFLDAVEAAWADTGLDALLHHGDDETRLIGALWGTSVWLRSEAKGLSRFVKHADTELPKIAHDVWESVLRGDIGQAVAVCTQAVKEIDDVLDHFCNAKVAGARTKRSAKSLAGAFRPVADTLHAAVAATSQ